MKFLTEKKEIYIDGETVFRDGKSLDKTQHMFYPDYVLNFNLIQGDKILECPRIGAVLVIFSKEDGNITEQVKIISTEE